MTRTFLNQYLSVPTIILRYVLNQFPKKPATHFSQPVTEQRSIWLSLIHRNCSSPGSHHRSRLHEMTYWHTDFDAAVGHDSQQGPQRSMARRVQHRLLRKSRDTTFEDLWIT